MKKLLLITLIALSFTSCATHAQPDTSVAAFKRASHYSGQVCMVTPDAKCSNGVPYNRATVNAYQGYILWKTCVIYPDAPVCSEVQ